MDFLGDVWAWFTDSHQWSGNSSIPNRLYEHVKMSVVAVALAIVAGLPIALWLGHKRRFGWLAINVSNVGRAVPELRDPGVRRPDLGHRDLVGHPEGRPRGPRSRWRCRRSSPTPTWACPRSTTACATRPRAWA